MHCLKKTFIVIGECRKCASSAKCFRIIDFSLFARSVIIRLLPSLSFRPVPPTRTNSHLETTFDSNCDVATSEITTTSKSNISTFSGSDLEGIRPMEPIVPLVPPPYNVVIRSGKTYRQNVHSPSARNGELFFLIKFSSLSEIGKILPHLWVLFFLKIAQT